MNKCKWCGEEATYQFKITKEFCCRKYPQQCKKFKEKLSKAKIGIKRSKKSINKQKQSMKGKYSKPLAKKITFRILCDYKCGEIAQYQFGNGKYCCSKNYRSCKGWRQDRKITNKTGPKPIKIENLEKFKCSYGCDSIANYQFKNGKYCCSYTIHNCKNHKKIVTKKQKDHLSNLNKKDIIYWKNKYPFFSKIEQIRYKPGEKEIQVHCQNNKCQNSKEKGGWFTPTYIQLYERIRQLENPNGNGGSYFYCSEKCKDTCILYGLQSDPYKDTDLPYTQEELHTWKSKVKELDNNQCQYCGSKKNIHVHHIIPIKLQPLFALDPDNGVCLCETCHYEIGHKTGTECSTGNLSSNIC